MLFVHKNNRQFQHRLGHFPVPYDMYIDPYPAQCCAGRKQHLIEISSYLLATSRPALQIREICSGDPWTMIKKGHIIL